jgi:hypothetical protein
LRGALAWAAPPALFLLLATGAGGQQPAVGLSPVRAQTIANQPIGSFPALQNDHFAWSLASGDFNGDGRAELASGIPDDDGPTTALVTDGGGLIVSQYFPPTGLDPVKFVRQSAGLDAPEAGDRFGGGGLVRGGTLASCDFNHDGFDDLAVGMPAEDVGPDHDEGAVQTHYGRASSFPGFGSEFFTQNTAGIPGDSENVDFFGNSLACGDFNGDGYADLVVGVPGERIGFESADAGMIDILPGWSGGLASDNAYALDQDSSSVGGEAEAYDFFAWSLAAGNFDGDAYDDLAVGVIGEDDVGAVQIFFGSASGLNGARDLFLYDEDLGGTREANDYFGEVLAAGDFNGDGYDDLAIGAPREEGGTTGGDVESGEVKVAYGAPGGFDFLLSRRFTQDVMSGGETTQAGDNFGAALAVGDFNRDGRDDLAIGAPGEGIATADGQDGHVTVMLGKPLGLDRLAARGIIAGSNGVPGNVNEHHKNFGWSLAAGDFDGDGHDDLAIGAPFETASGLGDAGAQTILYGALFADGFETHDATYWSAVAP